MNQFKTFLLLFALSLLFIGIGAGIGGTSGAIFALGFAIFFNFIAYWNSDKMVLKMTKAILADEHKYSKLYKMVNNLANNANIPLPKIYIIDNQSPNAFATGRSPKNAVVAVSTGLLNVLDENELSGVIAHELAHIKNMDTLISTVSASVASAISMLANMFLFLNIFGGGQNRVNPLFGLVIMFLAPVSATIIQMAISRQREYIADRIGGEICGNPLFLANALTKIEQAATQQRVSMQPQGASSNIYGSDKTKDIAHMYIINPFSGKRDSFFSTHPSTQNRVSLLRQQAEIMGLEKIHTPVGSSPDNNPLEKNIQKKDAHIMNNPWV